MIKKFIICLFVCCSINIQGETRPMLSEPRLSLGADYIGNGELTLGVSLPFSDTQSIYFSYGWMDLTMSDVPIIPFPFLDVDGFNWVSVKKGRLKSSSVSFGFRWLSYTEVKTISTLFRSYEAYSEYYWTFLIRSQDFQSVHNLRYFDAFETGDIRSDDDYITLAFGITNVIREYDNGNIADSGSIAHSLLLGFNMNSQGGSVYPRSQIAINLSTSIYF